MRPGSAIGVWPTGQAWNCAVSRILPTVILHLQTVLYDVQFVNTIIVFDKDCRLITSYEMQEFSP